MSTIKRKAFPSDLSGEQWELIEVMIPGGRKNGRPREVALREVVNSMLYLARKTWVG